jgi:hypothetical protein
VALAIDTIVQAAHAFDPKSKMNDDLKPAIFSLFDELQKNAVDYLLVGGVALLSYVDGRNTQDIDLIISANDIGKMPWNGRAQDEDFGSATYHGVRVDLLLRSNALFDEVARSERATIEFGGHRIPAATRRGLLLLKLYALPSLYRRQNFARAALYETDILMLHQDASIDDEGLLVDLSKHLPQHDIAELRRILAEQAARKRFI